MSASNVLRRLRSDVRGNTLAILAVALIPVTAAVGSAVDVSRAYMAKTKLQSACDASSLAARRVMQYDELTDEVEATGKEFFEFNFEDGIYETTHVEPIITKPETGVIKVEAATQVPNVVMHMFGYDATPIAVDCEASLNFVNTDVVLVLDVTGSMADPLNGEPKIEALREAVLALYDELEPVQRQLESQGLRLRYGIAPYSSTVNVGRVLYDVDPSYIRSSASYPSRVANFNTLVHAASPPTSAGAWEYYSGSSGSGSSTPTTSTRNSSQCSSWVTSSGSSGGGPAPVATYTIAYRGSASSAGYDSSQDWGWAGAPTTTGTNRSCRRWKVTTTTTYEPKRQFTNWTYRHETYDLSSYKQPGGFMTIATNATGTAPPSNASYNAHQLAQVSEGGSNTSITWNGCIEERDTTSSINGGTSLTAPSNAYDLNINLIPNSDATRWRPMVPDVVYTRTAGSTSANSSANNVSTTGWIKNYPIARAIGPVRHRRAGSANGPMTRWRAI